MSPQDSLVATIKRDINRQPFRHSLLKENTIKLTDGFKRLQKFTGETWDLETIFLSLGLPNNSEWKKLSISENANIYDIIETYELGSRLEKYHGNWETVWESIKNELLNEDNQYGAATPGTVENLKFAFLRVYQSLRDTVNFKSIQFENIAANKEGHLKLI